MDPVNFVPTLVLLGRVYQSPGCCELHQVCLLGNVERADTVSDVAGGQGSVRRPLLVPLTSEETIRAESYRGFLDKNKRSTL